MTFDELAKKIKSRGYWRINFQPLKDEVKLKTLVGCKEIVEKNRVELRGWDYPHFPRREGDDTGLLPMNNYYRGWINWMNHVEFWHMYQSGQFLHYLALREDWIEDDAFAQYIGGTRRQIKPMSVLGVTGTVFQITEIYEFLARLAKEGIYEEGVRVSISFNNTEQRELWVDSPQRLHFMFSRKTGEKNISFSKEYGTTEIISGTKELSFEVIKYFFERFGWHNMAVETIKKDQEDLLARRI